jgi:hypothetical protein
MLNSSENSISTKIHQESGLANKKICRKKEKKSRMKTTKNHIKISFRNITYSNTTEKGKS